MLRRSRTDGSGETDEVRTNARVGAERGAGTGDSTGADGGGVVETGGGDVGVGSSIRTDSDGNGVGDDDDDGRKMLRKPLTPTTAASRSSHPSIPVCTYTHTVRNG